MRLRSFVYGHSDMGRKVVSVLREWSQKASVYTVM
jgi:hypothetical protein